MAFKRLLEARSTFRRYSAKLSPQKRKMYEEMYTEQGVFQLKEQTAQVCFFYSPLDALR
jgi:hypothetical protein